MFNSFVNEFFAKVDCSPYFDLRDLSENCVIIIQTFQKAGGKFQKQAGKVPDITIFSIRIVDISLSSA